MTPDRKTYRPDLAVLKSAIGGSYPWAKYAAKQLHGEPDTRFKSFDIPVDAEQDHWLLLGMQSRLYGPEWMNADAN